MNIGNLPSRIQGTKPIDLVIGPKIGLLTSDRAGHRLLNVRK